MLKLKPTTTTDPAKDGREDPSPKNGSGTKSTNKTSRPRKPINWLKILTISNIAVIALVAAGLGGMALIHQSDTNPNFCGTCHIMQPNVNAYLTGHTMDNVHKEAGVQCKDCHDYPIPAEVSSGVNYLIGNYEVNKQGTLIKREYADAMCLDCHISQQYVADETDYLFRNPHNSHWGFLPCGACHISHGEQIDYCSSCHENGGQRMTGETIEDRGKIGRPGESQSKINE